MDLKRLYVIREAKARPKQIPPYKKWTWNSLLFDRFATTEQQFRSEVNAAASKLFGDQWDVMVDAGYGPGSTEKLLKALWDNNWSPHEALGEISHYFDISQSKFYPDETHNMELDGEDLTEIYPMKPERLVRYDYSKDADDWVPRAERPTSRDFWGSTKRWGTF